MVGFKESQKLPLLQGGIHLFSDGFYDPTRSSVQLTCSSSHFSKDHVHILRHESHVHFSPMRLEGATATSNRTCINASV